MSEVKTSVTGKVIIVTIDRPPVNAMTLSLYAEMAKTFEAISQRMDVNCVVLTSAGSKAFCAGKDLQEFLATTVEDDPKQAPIVRGAFRAVQQCSIPVIAAVNGAATGAGCVFASLADIRLASSNAFFSLPEINIGRCGGAAHMGRHLPQGVLRRIFFTGDKLSAEDAYRLGFVDQVLPPEELLPAAMALATRIAAKSPLGLRLAKKTVNEGERLALETALDIEQRYSTELLHTEDAREAARAVFEKRAPTFVGR